MQRSMLIVEDELSLRTIYRRVLGSFGLKIVEAGDGAEALEYLQNHIPDILLLDMLLPAVSGQAVLNFLTNDPRFEDMHIMIVTSHKHFEQVSHNTPQCQFFLKPIHPSQIRETVSKIIEVSV